MFKKNLAAVLATFLCGYAFAAYAAPIRVENESTTVPIITTGQWQQLRPAESRNGCNIQNSGSNTMRIVFQAAYLPPPTGTRGAILQPNGQGLNCRSADGNVIVSAIYVLGTAGDNVEYNTSSLDFSGGATGGGGGGGAITTTSLVQSTLAPNNFSVTATAATILSANTNRVVRLIYNNGTVPIFIGGASVTTANGFPVPAGASFDASRFSGALYAVSTTACDVRIVEY